MAPAAEPVVLVEVEREVRATKPRYLSARTICARYDISHTAWKRAWLAYLPLRESVRRFRAKPGGKGQRRWPEEVVERWWEGSSR